MLQVENQEDRDLYIQRAFEHIEKAYEEAIQTNNESACDYYKIIFSLRIKLKLNFFFK
jgi:hypothetical protein